MASLPASHPNIPYLGLIPNGLHHGKMIRINGEMLHHDRFAVNIKTGAAISPSDDINLHLSVRPYENAIVRNHMVHQAYGPEERIGGCPIHYGQHFELLILAETEQFKIAVNGQHFCEFRHRIPLHAARFIHVEGLVKIHSIKVETDPGSMSPSAPLLPTMTTQINSYQPPTPYQSYQQPYSTHNHHSPYGSMSTTIRATPTQTSYPPGQYNPTHQIGYYQQQPCLSSQPCQQYPSYHTYQTTQPYEYASPKSNSGSKALKYAAGIGGIGLGAYALSRMFDSDCHSDSD